MATTRATVDSDQMRTNREDCVLMFKLMSFVLDPAIEEYMKQEKMVASDDNRVNIKILQGNGPKKFRNKNRHIQRKLNMTVLSVVLAGYNSVSHVDLDDIEIKKDTFIQSFIDLCQEMGAAESADTLKNYIGPAAIRTPPLYLIKTPKDELVWQTVQIFSMLVLHVSPSINKYAANLTQDKDPYEVLKLLKQMGENQPSLLGADTIMITKGSFDGRNSACHSKKKEIGRDSDRYIESFQKLCQEVGEKQASKKILLTKKKMDLRARLMTKLKVRAQTKKWVVTSTEKV